MPRPQPRPRPRPTTPVRPVVISPSSVPSLYNKVKSTTEKLLKNRLGIPTRQALPAKVKTLVDNEIKKILSDNISEMVKSDIRTAVRAGLKAPSLQVFDDKIKSALTSARHIGQSPDVAKILKQKAELLFAKRKAYKDAGFSEQEAMQILLAEITAKRGS